MSMTGGGGAGGGAGALGAEKAGDRNGSLMHTTMDSIMDDNSSAAAHSVYRMHPLHHAKLRDKDRDRDRDSLDD
ncbi:hypothetical protein ACOMHN_005935 [Nucella lapillus]